MNKTYVINSMQSAININLVAFLTSIKKQQSLFDQQIQNNAGTDMHILF